MKRKYDEPTGHANEQEHAHGGDGNAGIAARVGGGGMNQGLKGIWRRKGLLSSLKEHPGPQADADSVELLRRLRHRRRWCTRLERPGFGQTLSSGWA